MLYQRSSRITMINNIIRSIRFKIYLMVFFVSGFCFPQKELTLQNIWLNYHYIPQYLSALNWASDTTYYKLTAKEKSSSIYELSIKKGEIIDSMILNFHTLDFEINSSKTHLIALKKSKKQYRHSFLGKYELVNLKSNTHRPLDDEFIKEVSFSPDGTKVSFIKNNNLFYFDIAKNQTFQLTKNGKEGAIINGHTDWVYEEEFGFTKAYEWSEDSKFIAYMRFDESAVREYQMQIWDSLYPSFYTYKYPKAGEKNADVSILVYDLVSQKEKRILHQRQESGYITQVKWVPGEEKQLSIQLLNRLQNHFQVHHYDVSSDTLVKIYEEHSSTYVEVPFIDYGPEGKSMIITTEKDGFRHLYQHNNELSQITFITKGNWEVDQVLGVDWLNKKIYYTSTEDGSINRTTWKVDLLTKKRKRISPKKNGTSLFQFNPNYTWSIETYSQINRAPTYTVFDRQYKAVRVIEGNEKVTNRIQYLPKTVLSSSKSKPYRLNTYTLYPPNFKSSKKYPVLIYVYGGPGYQTVKDSWQGNIHVWHQYMATKGYVVVSVDGRGTGGRGQEYKNSTYGHLGDFETLDVIEFAKEFSKNKFVDTNRIGIWGWSFGGYLSSMALLKGNDVFKLGIAVAPVINWRWYDAIYSERFLKTPQLNPKGYDDNSPINFAGQLKGKYLLIHGTSDDNVHVQHSLMMQQALNDVGKPFDMHIYTNKNHGIYGGKTRYHLFKKITDYIFENL